MLELDEVTISYGPKTAVRQLSITAGQKQITTIIGSNGAGKTTTLKAISGLLPTSGGKIRFMGEVISGRTCAEVFRYGLAHVPEGRELFPRMTVYDNLMMGAYTRRDRGRVTADLDKTFHYFPVLKDKMKLLARNLSGGEQQMLAFGRALMSNPKMLLLDEPSIGLAPLIEQHLIATVAKLVEEEGLGVLLVEQNAALALSVSNIGYVLDLGSLVLAGKASELMRNEDIRRVYLGH
ncbi:amino acid/amide ABC transporter ATP-binding protein 2, HAAT family [Arboricoccus pini]|uniref:Amino acid/amide ABC transporter ATP-binding protein 2, HAAT family n=1 Tax=Arboricoccus pini TaxID=1963835 RepID=A0A212PZZ4_9PROT|nr:ABC transporter ATP-binding protein [Arboricoccus pini]SNB52647.1 amino acid/amide ABC transporter ATP-binding protein 2, HAAT family [Arboricoccus pini]